MTGHEMQWDAAALEEGLDLFRELALGEPALRAELEASAREYFRGQLPGDPTSPAGRSADRRHLEWFLFERTGGGSQPRPAERLLAAWCERAPDGWADGVDTFLNSHASMFEVVEVEPGRGGQLRDLAGLGRYVVEEPEASQVLCPGDLVVGRLFPVDGRHRISAAAGLFRNPELLRALERDLERAREDRRHPVLRVAQPELEAMFWGAGGAPAPPADPVGDARRFLRASGLGAERTEAILASLAAAPYAPDVIVLGAGDRLGEVLEQLAFDTEIDLARARELLVAAWAVLSAPGQRAEPETRRTTETIVERAVHEFERDRANGVDLEASFDKLERSLGLDEPGDAGEEDPGEAPDFPGVVDAVIEEFLWEVGCTDGEAAAGELAPLRALGAFARGIGVLENLRARDLLSFAAFWLPERRLLRDPNEARAMLAALRRFSDWVEATQALELGPELREQLAGLEHSLPRIARANLGLGAGEEDAEDPGQLYELRGTDGRGTLWLVDADGAEAVAQIPAALASDLRPGDRLRVRAERDGVRVITAYPPESAALVAGR